MFCTLFVFSQNKKADSLFHELKNTKQDSIRARLYIEIGDVFKIKSTDSAIFFYEKSLILAKKLKNISIQSKVLLFMGVAYKSQNDFKRALEYYTKSLELSEILCGSNDKKKSIEGKKGVCACYVNIAIINSNSDYHQALDYYLKALNIYDELSHSQIKTVAIWGNNGKGRTFSDIGLVYSCLGNHTKAMEYYHKSLNIYEVSDNKEWMANCYSNIGLLYFNQNDYKQAVLYYTKSFNLRKELRDKKGMADCYVNIGAVACDGERNFSLALENYQKALLLYKDVNYQKGISYCYGNIGIIYKAQGEISRAFEYCLKSLEFIKIEGDKNAEAIIKNNIADMNIKLKNYSKAIEYANEVKLIAGEIGSLESEMDSYQLLSAAYDSLGNKKEALKNFKLFSEMKDSLFSKEKTNAIAEMETKYQTEKKEHKISLLEKDNKLHIALLNKQQIKTMLIAIVSGLLIISFILFYLYSKAKQKAKFNKELLNQQNLGLQAISETQEKERTRIARDLHDGVGQLLAGIRINLSSIKNDITYSTDNSQGTYEKTILLVDEVCTEVRAVSHEMMPKSLTNSGLVNAADELLSYTLKRAGIEYNYEFYQVGKLPEKIEINLYRIMQEIIHNIIKHSSAKKVSVQLMQNNNNIILIAEDDGVGFKLNSQNKGIGLLNITSRISSLNGSFSIEPGHEKGTVITIRIPLNPQS